MEPRPQTLLEVDQLTIRIGARTVVDGASFRLGAGERVALLGPSGAGKTTLLRGVVGLIEVAGGAVRYDGQEVEAEGMPAFRRAVIWVSQRPVMRAGTVEENFAGPFAYASNGGHRFQPARGRALLEALGLGEDRLTVAARRLSEGQQKRVALARALLLEPRALLLDEPTSGLDAVSAELVERLLIAEGDSCGLACAVVTHDPIQAERLCHRVVDLGPWLLGETA